LANLLYICFEITSYFVSVLKMALVFGKSMF
jgi:hypothetical protein